MKRYTTDLIRSLAATHQRSQEHYRQALREITTAIADELARGHEVQLTDFGTFYTRMQPAAHIRDIRTGKPLAVAAHRRVAFRVGELLKGAVHPTNRTPHKPNGLAKPHLKRFLGI